MEWPVNMGMSGEVGRLVEELAEVVAVWETAVSERDEAAGHRAAAMARADRQLAVVLGGMTLRRWRNRAAGKASILTAADAREANLARRRRPGVEAALAGLEETRSEEETAVRSAEEVLAVATARLLAYGPVAGAITGRPMAELASMVHARRPSRSSLPTGRWQPGQPPGRTRPACCWRPERPRGEGGHPSRRRGGHRWHRQPRR